MSQKVTRDVNNNTNRQVNCIAANIGKAVNAAVKQMKAIEVIQNTIGIENLPETLSEAALARIANPEGSLKELLMALDNKISKGALAQRFDKIIKLAEELGVPERDIVEALDAVSEPISLHANVYGEGDDALELLEQIYDKNSTEERWTENFSLRDSLKKITDRERDILTTPLSFLSVSSDTSFALLIIVNSFLIK